jgi:hypothetical protein
MVVVAILSILVAIALPSARDFVARKRLESVAQELASDLRLLKSHQIQHRPDLGTSINFGANSERVCYALYTRGNGIGTGAHCDCGLSTEQMCGTAGEQQVQPVRFRQVDIPVSTGIVFVPTPSRLTVNTYNGLPMFDITLSVAVKKEGLGEIKVFTNALGMPSVCSVSGVFGAIRPCTSSVSAQ